MLPPAHSSPTKASRGRKPSSVALSNPVAAAFGVEDRDVPAAILIGPDGKVIATGLRYNEMIEAVQAGARGVTRNKAARETMRHLLEVLDCDPRMSDLWNPSNDVFEGTATRSPP